MEPPPRDPLRELKPLLRNVCRNCSPALGWDDPPMLLRLVPGAGKLQAPVLLLLPAELQLPGRTLAPPVKEGRAAACVQSKDVEAAEPGLKIEEKSMLSNPWVHAHAR
jgi:hypothetical protein